MFKGITVLGEQSLDAPDSPEGDFFDFGDNDEEDDDDNDDRDEDDEDDDNDDDNGAFSTDDDNEQSESNDDNSDAEENDNENIYGDDDDEDDNEEDDEPSNSDSASDDSNEETDIENHPHPTTHLQSAATYIPPHLRKQSNTDRLTKHLRGLINRLSENSLESTAKSIIEMYSNNSTNGTSCVEMLHSLFFVELNDILTSELLEAICRVPRNTFTGLYTALIACISIQTENDIGNDHCHSMM